MSRTRYSRKMLRVIAVFAVGLLLGHSALSQSWFGPLLSSSPNQYQTTGTNTFSIGDATNGNGFSVVDPGASAAQQVQATGGTASAPPKLGGSNSSDIVFTSPIALGNSQQINSGSSATVGAGITSVILESGISSPFTLTLTASTAGKTGNGHLLLLLCETAVASLTVAANTGESLNATPSSCVSGTGHLFFARGANATIWDMIF